MAAIVAVLPQLCLWNLFIYFGGLVYKIEFHGSWETVHSLTYNFD